MTIDDNTPDGLITITGGGWDLGFSVNGTALPFGTFVGGSATAPESSPVTFNGAFSAPGVVTSGSETTYFTEAANPSLISDILVVNWNYDGTAAHIDGSFTSDVNDNLGFLTPGTPRIVEDGTPFTGFELTFLNVTINSDVDAVPDTGVGLWSVLTLGGVCLLGCWDRKRRSVLA